MAESNLLLTYTDYQKAVARQLGYSTTSTDWSTAEAAEIADIIESGQRQFYAPPPIGGRVHAWSFLKPTAMLTTLADRQTYGLPDDFASLADGPAFNADSCYSPLSVVGEGQIRGMEHLNIGSGVPQYVAVRWGASDGTLPQRWEMVFWPTPDAAYVLTYRYNVDPKGMSSTNLYPLGGLQHAETILESCLAIAEQRADDAPGQHTARFTERLAASIAADLRTTAHTVGNMSTGPLWKNHPGTIIHVTLDGTEY